MWHIKLGSAGLFQREKTWTVPFNLSFALHLSQSMVVLHLLKLVRADVLFDVNGGHAPPCGVQVPGHLVQNEKCQEGSTCLPYQQVGQALPTATVQEVAQNQRVDDTSQRAGQHDDGWHSPGAVGQTSMKPSERRREDEGSRHPCEEDAGPHTVTGGKGKTGLQTSERAGQQGAGHGQARLIAHLLRQQEGGQAHQQHATPEPGGDPGSGEGRPVLLADQEREEELLEALLHCGHAEEEDGNQDEHQNPPVPHLLSVGHRALVGVERQRRPAAQVTSDKRNSSQQRHHSGDDVGVLDVGVVCTVDSIRTRVAWSVGEKTVRQGRPFLEGSRRRGRSVGLVDRQSGIALSPVEGAVVNVVRTMTWHQKELGQRRGHNSSHHEHQLQQLHDFPALSTPFLGHFRVGAWDRWAKRTVLYVQIVCWLLNVPATG